MRVHRTKPHALVGGLVTPLTVCYYASPLFRSRPSGNDVYLGQEGFAGGRWSVQSGEYGRGVLKLARFTPPLTCILNAAQQSSASVIKRLASTGRFAFSFELGHLAVPFI